GGYRRGGSVQDRRRGVRAGPRQQHPVHQPRAGRLWFPADAGTVIPGEKDSQSQITQITRIANSIRNEQENPVSSPPCLSFSRPCYPCNRWFSCVFLAGFLLGQRRGRAAGAFEDKDSLRLAEPNPGDFAVDGPVEHFDAYLEHLQPRFFEVCANGEATG